MVDKLPATPRRRDAILAAAEREFASQGYDGARIERIAGLAGVNKQLLFHYFDSKEGLFSAAVGAILGRFDAAETAGPNPAESVRARLGGLVAAARAEPGLVGLLADARANPRFPREAAELLRRWMERLLYRLTADLEDGQRRGYFRDDMDPARLAAVASGAALGRGALPSAGGSADDSIDAYLTHLVTDHCAWR